MVSNIALLLDILIVILLTVTLYYMKQANSVSINREPLKRTVIEMSVYKEDGAELPEYAHGEEDTCLDLKANEEVIIPADGWKLIKTGLKVAIPPGYGGFVNPRSGLALKEGITVLNSDGVIDAGYRGDIGVILVNFSDKPYMVEKGDRIAQFSVMEVPRIEWNEVSTEEDLNKSKRGQGGFGHTGT